MACLLDSMVHQYTDEADLKQGDAFGITYLRKYEDKTKEGEERGQVHPSQEKRDNGKVEEGVGHMYGR